MSKALLKFLYPTSAHPNATQIFQKIWPNDSSVSQISWCQRALLTSMIDLYSTSTAEDQAPKLSRILDLSQDLKAMNLLLTSKSYLFVLDLACFASRREYLKLDKWLNDKIQSNGPVFLDSTLQFLKRRCPAFTNDYGNNTFPNEIFNMIFTCLKFYIPSDQEFVKMYNKYTQWVNQCQMAIPTKPNQCDGTFVQAMHSLSDNQSNNLLRLNSSSALSNTANQFPNDIDLEFSKEIEEEADLYFQKIYNQDQPGSMSIDEVLEMLKRFKDSPNTREKEVFLCMIRNLFKEYPYLQQYPEKELVITGETFGGVILHEFVKGYAFVYSLRYVLESLKKPVNTHYWIFGRAALNKFKTRLKEFPQFCQHLVNIPHFYELPQNLIDYVEFGKQSLDPSAASSNVKKSGVVVANHKSTIMNNIECPVSVSETPPASFQEKIAFLINNLSQMTLHKKAEEFKEAVLKEKESYRLWIAQYFILKRVCLEPNYHDLYASFLEILDMPSLSKLILQETYRNIQLLLRTNRETDSSSEKGSLKNLGQWLGLITLAFNKPVLDADLDLRSLLVESYQKGVSQLFFTVPFITKVISGCSKSKVFRPPNPWTVSLINLLVELHSLPDLKLNLKFEVEVLCNHLGIELKDFLGRSNVLKSKEPLSDVESQLSGVMQPVHVTQSEIPPMSNHSPSSFDGSFPNQMSPVISSSGSLHNFNEVNTSNLGQSLTIQPNIPLLLMNPNLRIQIVSFIEKTVQEYIPMVLERVLKVTLITTETLIGKDFALENNADLMRGAVHSMIKCLIAGYSLIITKESLTTRLQAALQNLLCSKCINVNKEVIEATVTLLLNDNIDICVCFVQKTCIERGLEEIDKNMKMDYDLRQSGRFEETLQYPMPEAFRHRNSMSSFKQMAVYEYMGRNLPGFVALSPVSSIHSIESSFKPVNTMAATNYPVVPNEVSATLLTSSNDAIVNIYDRMLKHLTELIQEFEYVPFNHTSMNDVLEVLTQAKQNPRDQNTTVALIKAILTAFRELVSFPQEVVSEYSVTTRTRDFYLLLIKALTDQRAFNVRFTAMHITRLVIEHWYISKQSFPDPLFDLLSRSNLINHQVMDTEFYTILKNGSNQLAITIIFNFLKYYLSNGLNSMQFPNTIELMQQLSTQINQSNPFKTDIKIILQHAVSRFSPNDIEGNGFDQKVKLIILEWINCFNNSKNLSNSFTLLVKHMNTQVIFTGFPNFLS